MKDFVTKVKRVPESGPAARRPRETGPYVELMLDRNFKLFFGSEERKELLLALLQEFLPELDIVSVELGNWENISLRKELKNSVFDVKCRTGDGRNIIVEAQYNSRPDYLDRMLYYSYWPVTEQVRRGNQYNYQLSEVYILSFTTFALEHDTDWSGDVVSSYAIREDSNGEKMTEALHFRYVELGRFEKREEELEGLRDRWLYCLKNLGRMKGEMRSRKGAAAGRDAVDQLVEAARVQALSDADRDLYIKNMESEFDIQSEKWYARQAGLEEGRAAGLAMGREEGIAKGIEKGIEKGKAEVARAMKAAGLPVEEISRFTSLAPEQIEAL